ncbi:MAG: nitrate reductase associated protein [Snowella sp.]
MTDYLFQFEQDFVDSLRCIPMLVRLKLDTCGVKLKLVHWNHFNSEERQSLLQLPCSTSDEIKNYRQFLQDLITQKTGQPATEIAIASNPLWLDPEIIPDSVQSKAIETRLTLTQSQWRSLTPIQRFALIKLGKASHENHNFVPALQEFGLC